jgi:uncharacterized protein (DUF924 family)
MVWFFWDASYAQVAAEDGASRSAGERRFAEHQTSTAPKQEGPRHGIDLDKATKHRDGIGVDRLPDRATTLGRRSSSEEVVFLATVLHGLGR